MTVMMKIVFLVSLCLSLAAAVPTGERLALRQNVRGCSNRNHSQCFPSGITGVPQTLIECLSTDVCSCMDCFKQNETSGRCIPFIETPSNCYFYNQNAGTCTDNRRSQLVAFILSITLSGVGAGNFYIGQNGLGAGQLVLFLSTFVIVCLAVCIPICIFCCIEGDCASGSIFGGCCIFLLVLLSIAVSLALVAWWIADAVIFGLNERPSGDGCPLQPW